jgi:hypothetical protein
VLWVVSEDGRGSSAKAIDGRKYLGNFTSTHGTLGKLRSSLYTRYLKVHRRWS